MKLSVFIEKLELIEKEHGDIDVFCWPYDGQGKASEINASLKPTKSPMLGDKKVLFIDAD